MAVYLPALSFDGNYNARREGAVYGGQYFPSQVQHWGPELKLSYLLWDSGERKYSTENAFQLLQQSNWTHNEEVQKVMQIVASSYYEHLYSEALLEAYESDLLNAEETYKAAQENVWLGFLMLPTLCRQKQII